MIYGPPGGGGFADLSIALKPETPTLYTATVEVDLRTPLWRRVSSAIRSGEYIAPPGRYPWEDVATAFIVRRAAGTSTVDLLEARLDVAVDERVARVIVEYRDKPRVVHDAQLGSGVKDIVGVVLSVVSAM